MNERTAVYLEPSEHQRLKEIAHAENRTTTELMREAILQYMENHPAPPLPAEFDTDLDVAEPEAETAEELLKGSGPG
jgi:hypothetical protein